MDHAAITAEQVLGKRVAELRQARGWSQDELARRMTDAGFHWRQTTVAKTEKADRPVRVNEAATLMQLFGVDIDYLVTSHQSPVLPSDRCCLREAARDCCRSDARAE